MRNWHSLIIVPGQLTATRAIVGPQGYDYMLMKMSGSMLRRNPYIEGYSARLANIIYIGSSTLAMP
jgi:hypothetical protein